MEHELRILSGLHRGACLPLGPDNRLTVGGDPQCDVVLVDPGLQPVECSVELLTDGWRLARFDRKGRRGEAVELPWGRAVALGGVVVVVCEGAQAWEFVSAEQLKEADQAAPAQAAKRGATADGADAASKGRPHRRGPAQGAAGRSWRDRVASLRAGSGPKFKQRLIVMGAVMLGFTTFSISRTISPSEQGAVAAAASDRAAGPARAAFERPEDMPPTGAGVRPEAARSELARSMMGKDSEAFDAAVARVLGEPQGAAGAQGRAGAAAATAKSAPPKAALTHDQLRTLMVQRLKDAYLADKLDLDLTESAWNMRGVLDDEDSRLFGRILASFYKEHGVKIPLHAYVNSAEEMLPFKIKQFSGGALASVVTDDGQRLYLGDAHKGYTLQRIDGRRIVFAGKRKVEVVW